LIRISVALLSEICLPWWLGNIVL